MGEIEIVMKQENCCKMTHSSPEGKKKKDHCTSWITHQWVLSPLGVAVLFLVPLLPLQSFPLPIRHPSHRHCMAWPHHQAPGSSGCRHVVDSSWRVSYLWERKKYEEISRFNNNFTDCFTVESSDRFWEVLQLFKNNQSNSYVVQRLQWCTRCLFFQTCLQKKKKKINEYINE